MLRITYLFNCNHGGNKANAIEVKYRGHSAPDEKRVCFCTGEAVDMIRSVEVYEPEAEKMQQ